MNDMSLQMETILAPGKTYIVFSLRDRDMAYLHNPIRLTSAYKSREEAIKCATDHAKEYHCDFYIATVDGIVKSSPEYVNI